MNHWSVRQNFGDCLVGALLTEIEMAAIELTVQTAVCSYHVYKDIRTPAISEVFVCGQEWGNDHDRHAVAVHGDGEDELGDLPCEISSVAFFLRAQWLYHG